VREPLTADVVIEAGASQERPMLGSVERLAFGERVKAEHIVVLRRTSRRSSLEPEFNWCTKPRMGNLRACFVIASLALAAACGSDSAKPDASIKIIDASPDSPKVWEDAPPGPNYDFSCMGNTAPTTATADITLSGTAQRVGLGGATALADATLKACKADAATCSGQDQYGTTATSATDGSWSIGPFASGGTPVNGYVSMTAANTRPTLMFPPSPLAADLGMIPILGFDPQLISLLGQAGCTQDDAANGIVTLLITDCAMTPIDGGASTTISVKQGGTEVTGTTVIDLGQLSAQAAGTYLVCNVPENAGTTVTTGGATYNGMMLRAHDVKVVKATTTITILRPGF
jgi:hypothetical protein